jgi:hypothetical protein
MNATLSCQNNCEAGLERAVGRELSLVLASIGCQGVVWVVIYTPDEDIGVVECNAKFGFVLVGRRLEFKYDCIDSADTASMIYHYNKVHKPKPIYGLNRIAAQLHCLLIHTREWRD